MTGRTAARSAFALASLSAALVASPAYARSAAPASVTVTCGESVTTSITVANNLTCAAGDGLSIDAPNITLNLNGHTITGAGTGVGVSIGQSEPTSAPGDVLENGTVTDFSSAVAFGLVSDPELDHVTLSDDGAGGGIVLKTEGSELPLGAEVASSTITGTVGYVLFAQIEDSGGITFINTAVTGGQLEVSQTGPADFVDDTFTDVPVTLNFEGAALISGSKFIDSPVVDGPLYSGDQITGNTFEKAATALTIDDMNDEQITGNTFSDNVIGFDLQLDPDGPSGGETVTGNTFTANTAAGLLVNATVSTTSPGLVDIGGNTATRNGASPAGTVDGGGNPVAGGIHVYDPTAVITVSNNSTGHNKGYGIWALPGTVVGSNNNSISDQDKCDPTDLCTY